MADSPSKADDGPLERRSAGYKSWKKKYRKMRIVFDQKMQQSEELHKREDKASATPPARHAPRNQQLSPNPLREAHRRRPQAALGLAVPVLPLDRRQAANDERKDGAAKRLEQLLHDVPHSSYAATRDSHPATVADLSAPDGEAHPASFLSADDIDNYIFAVDSAMDPDGKHAALPTLAPRAHPNATPAPHPQIKNPTSVTNWLRKHAPKVFLQDGEHGPGADAAGGDDHADGHHGHGAGGHTGGRKSRGGRGGERGGRGSRGKRASAAARHAADREYHSRHRGGDREASADEDHDFGSTPAGRGKRKRDDDPGYRPGGSTSRPAKKKRKSEGGGPDGSTPVARRSKKDKDRDRERDRDAAAAAASASTSRVD
ncbi:hypothetical protein ACCO45_000188 [Purpureocillium lilacinum]|uniref:Uncharacterized protein n=1 Tax=Purpureocillium lilacinum TaxID=33203 RepID=A0ACC4E3H8_PURLI